MADNEENGLRKAFEKILKADGSGHIQTKLGYLAAATHCVMVQLGFELETKNQLFLSSTQPVCNLSYYIKGYKSGHCVIQMIPMGESIVVVTATFAESQDFESFSCTDLLKYITKDGATYKVDFKGLPATFKREIGLPLLSRAKTFLGIAPGIETILVLPTELQLEICFRIQDPRTLLHYGATCKALHQVANTNEVWKRLFIKDYPNESGSETKSEDWKQKYKAKVLASRFHPRASSLRSSGWPQDNPPGGPGRNSRSDPGGDVPPRFRPRYDPPFPDFM